jgi:hypothetical protein
VTFFGRDDPLLPGLDRWVRHWKAVYRRRKRARGAVCIRCGEVATQTCEACRAAVCARCWVLSIETGMVSGLCLDCVAGSGEKRKAAGSALQGPALFRSGLRMVAWMIALTVALGYWQRGADGVRRIVVGLLDPAIVFALVPLAFLLGAIRVRFLRLVRAFLSERSAKAD